MSYTIFNDFVLHEVVPAKIVSKYVGKIPEQLLKVWREYGFGSILNGYFRIVNPEEFEKLLEDVYVRYRDAIVLFATSMGDIIVWEDNKYLILLNFRKGKIKAISSGFKFFFSDLEEGESYYEEVLDWWPYPQAAKAYGVPNFDECFGYVPILGMGGFEKIENLDIVKLNTHLYLITQFIGPIG